MTRDLVSSRKQDWSTPDHLVQHWISEFDLNTDLCAMPYNARLPNFITPEMDSLAKPWEAPIRGFCNPPYEDVGAWLRQALISCAHGAFSLHLIPANTDTRWFFDFGQHAQVDFFKGRINFVDRTPPAVEVERLMKCGRSKKNVEKIAHRLVLLWTAAKEELDETAAAVWLREEHGHAMHLCSEVLGDGWWLAHETEKKPGAGFPVMLLIFDPDAPAGAKPFRMRDSKTGALL